MRAVIIAGGSGTRLRPLTYNVPKPVVPVFDKPFIFYQIELLKNHGIDEIIINTHYLHSKLKELLGDGSKLGVKVFYSQESKPMGTAGAVKLAEEFFNDEPLVILNGDILTSFDISSIINFHKEKNADVSISLTRVKDPTAYGLVFTDEEERITKFLEKPSLDEATVNTVNAGIYIINPEHFKLVPNNEPYSFERGLFPLLLNLEKRVYGYTSNAYWLDIGTPEKYLQAHHDALLGRVDLNIPGEKTDGNIWLGKDVDIDKSVMIQGPVYLGDKVKIRKGCFIEEFSVIGRNSIIDDKTQIYKSLVWENTLIGENCTIQESIIGAKCKIEDDCKITDNSVIADKTNLGRGSLI